MTRPPISWQKFIDDMRAVEATSRTLTARLNSLADVRGLPECRVEHQPGHYGAWSEWNLDQELAQ